MNSIKLKSRLGKIKEQIIETANSCGRNPNQIKLVAVSKKHPETKIEEAFYLGHAIFGESYGQEFRDKHQYFSHHDSLTNDLIEWHFVGPLQKNKVKYILGKASLIHSVASEKILNYMDQRARRDGIHQDVLVQINSGMENSKHGLRPENTLDFLRKFESCTNLYCQGLMTLPPFFDDPEEVRTYFKIMADLKNDLNSENLKNVNLKHLSMGMSSDFKVAIEEGATIIRVGTAIFGPRD
ncbi:MAG: YggS family pyridoxal phosphate-dependent enzyme [Deltaproteobacteria bacterium]|jgi:pyridoxal phosphate enzyme (YggS family)|nr:YggS family pyridoxal phosphate-dependent enzyme [Deltaproteobacteria bacterium]